MYNNLINLYLNVYLNLTKCLTVCIFNANCTLKNVFKVVNKEKIIGLGLTRKYNLSLSACNVYFNVTCP